LAAIKLTDKSGYADSGYPDVQTLPSGTGLEVGCDKHFQVILL